MTVLSMGLTCTRHTCARHCTLLCICACQSSASSRESSSSVQARFLCALSPACLATLPSHVPGPMSRDCTVHATHLDVSTWITSLQYSMMPFKQCRCPTMLASTSCLLYPACITQVQCLYTVHCASRKYM